MVVRGGRVPRDLDQSKLRGRPGQLLSPQKATPRRAHISGGDTLVRTERPLQADVPLIYSGQLEIGEGVDRIVRRIEAERARRGLRRIERVRNIEQRLACQIREAVRRESIAC